LTTFYTRSLPRSWCWVL